jgi:hypothetical protein
MADKQQRQQSLVELRAAWNKDRGLVDAARGGERSDDFLDLAGRLGVDPAAVDEVGTATLDLHRHKLKAHLEYLGHQDRWTVLGEERDVAEVVWRYRAELIASDGPAPQTAYRDELYQALTADTKRVRNPDDRRKFDTYYLSPYPSDVLQGDDWMPDWSQPHPYGPVDAAAEVGQVESLEALGDRHRRELGRLAGEARVGLSPTVPSDLPRRQAEQFRRHAAELFDLIASSGYPEETLQALDPDWVRNQPLAEKSQHARQLVEADGRDTAPPVDRWLQAAATGTRAPEQPPAARVHRPGETGTQQGVEAGHS